MGTPSQSFAKRMDLTLYRGYAKETFTVPAIKRLVLTYVSSDCDVAPNVTPLFALGTFVNGQQVEPHLPFTRQGTIFGNEAFALSCPVTVYADSNTEVTVSVPDTDAVGSGGQIVGLYGYYVDAP